MTELIAGKTFSVQLTGGASWRLEYKAGGYYFVNTSGGFNGKGTWKAQDGMLCGTASGASEVCNEIRLSGGLLYLKRTNGEVITLTKK